MGASPSPTGPLHLGSLCTALLSWLHAREANGVWLVRIDDLDQFRCDPHWSQDIATVLAAHGLHPDATPALQSSRLEAYAAAFDALDDHRYHCRCSRKSLPPGPYPGHCRAGIGQAIPDQGAVRVDCSALCTTVDDLIQPMMHSPHPGDCVIRRGDSLYAYQLASAVDEQLDGITHVVRGIDLLDSTLWQRHLTQLLGGTPPRYGHLPIVVDQQGAKLSKQQGAAAIQGGSAGANYRTLAELLNRPDPPSAADSVATWLDWWLAQGPLTDWLTTTRNDIPIP